jgi:hypothetical protein
VNELGLARLRTQNREHKHFVYNNNTGLWFSVRIYSTYVARECFLYEIPSTIFGRTATLTEIRHTGTVRNITGNYLLQ